MRAGPIVSVVTALLSGTTLADFYIYEGWSTYSTGLDPTTEFYFFPGPPDCDDVNTGYTPYSPSDDVSGDKTGVRCDGCNAYGDSIAPTELEFNTDLGHYTWYGGSDRNGDLVDVDGNVAGNCVVDTSDTYDCTDTTASKHLGFSHLFCTSDLTV